MEATAAAELAEQTGRGVGTGRRQGGGRVLKCVAGLERRRASPPRRAKRAEVVGAGGVPAVRSRVDGADA